MAVGIIAASLSGTAARDGSVSRAWTRLRRPAARVCTLPIDKALQLSAARRRRFCVFATVGALGTTAPRFSIARVDA